MSDSSHASTRATVSTLIATSFFLANAIRHATRISAIAHALAAAIVVVSAAVLNSQAAAPLPADFDAYVARVLQTFKVPWVGVAIVKDGRVVMARGFGVKKVGGAAPVTPRTQFGIASNTKLFTATALGMLVEDGKIDR